MRGAGSKIERAARGQEVRLPESSGLTNDEDVLKPIEL